MKPSALPALGAPGADRYVIPVIGVGNMYPVRLLGTCELGIGQALPVDHDIALAGRRRGHWCSRLQ